MAGSKISLRSAILLFLVGALFNESTQRYRDDPISISSSDSIILSSSSKQAGTSMSIGGSNNKLSSNQEQTKTKTKTKTNKKRKTYKPIVPVETLPKEYKICRVDPSPVIDEPPVRMSGRGLPIWYQCAGKPYDDFMYKVYGLVLDKSTRTSTSSNKKWGRRIWICPKILDPDPPKRHRKILIIGNSHTRQMVSALLCQYRNDITTSRLLVPSTATKNVAIEYYLQTHDNLTIYVIVNHPFVYSKTWKATLEIDILKHPLHDLDAIVLGTFNSYRESRGTSFLNTTLAYQQQFPHQGVDFEHIRAPGLEEFVKVYPGPIIWVSMFAHYNVPIHQHTVEMMQTLQVTHNRSNLRSVDGRNYIDELGGEECSSNVGERVATCVTDRSDIVYKNGHRCTGDKGGQPDLIAWDVVDALHDLLR